MKIIELVLDETSPDDGVQMISLVKEPAIGSYWVALSESIRQQKFTQTNPEKRVVMGPAMIPDLPIMRRDPDGTEYHVYFSQATIRRCMEMYFQQARHLKTNYEHADEIRGVAVVESWIVENPDLDKSKIYDLKVPRGTWMVAMKIENETIWEEFVKTGDVKGFSIEGQFRDKLQMAETPPDLPPVDKLIAELDAMLGKNPS
jgi:hypothetical protein